MKYAKADFATACAPTEEKETRTELSLSIFWSQDCEIMSDVVIIIYKKSL